MKLYNADCLTVLKSLPSNSVDLVVTDPPYEVGTTGGGSINKVKHMVNSMQTLAEVGINKSYDIEGVGKELIRVMKNINIYISGVTKFRFQSTSISM